MTSLWLILLGLAVVVIGLVALRLHAFLAMMLAAITVALVTPEEVLSGYAATQVDIGKMSAAEAEDFLATSAPNRVLQAFGTTCGKMGLLIAMASIVGRCLLDSGAAMRIVHALLALFGRARVHLAFIFTGFGLAIPVYFDSVFYLLMPIGKAMARKTGRDYLLYILTIVAGATMAHSLVPPTPGPMFAADQLGVPLPMMMVAGGLLGLCTASVGLAWALWANRRYPLPLPDSDQDEEQEMPGVEDLPSLGFSLLPILIPLLLISHGTVSDHDFWFHHPSMALSLGAIAGLVLLSRHRLPGTEAPRDGVQEALMSGAVILIITAAGGAFGSTLRQTGIASLIQALGAGAGGYWALPLVFGITTLVRTAQGSATVAMITAAPIAAAVLEAGSLPFHPVYLALAVGCGSKPIPWLNDSGFWIITRMTGMRESQTLRFVTPMMSLMGLAGLPMVLLAAWIWPLI